MPGKACRKLCAAARVAGVLLWLALPAPVSVAADDDAPSRAEMREIVHGFLKAWEDGDAARIAALAHEDILFAYPGGRLDKAGLLETFERYQARKTDIRIYLWEHFLVDGERFASAYQFAATDRESGRRQAVGTGIAGRIADGKIVLLKEYYDEEVALRQYKGELPLDEGIVSPWPASVWLRPETID